MLDKANFVSELSERVKEIFWDNELMLGEKNEKKIKSEIDLITFGKKDYLDIEEVEIESEDYYIFIICEHLVKNEDEFKNKINDILQNMKKNFKFYNKIKVYFINYNYSDELNLKTRLKKYSFIEEVKKITKCKDVEVDYLRVSSIISNEYNIKIDSRIRALEIRLESEDDLIIEGHVFIADLCDIVNIFNDLGDEIFDYNIRVGIEDTYSVGEEIIKTIKENPKEFWFLNNGITMLVQDDDFSIKKTKSLVLRYGENKKISIINGAQTVTTAADVFLKKDSNLIERETAKVMLRIIHLKEPKAKDQKNKLRDIANKISLSLNRQKPIQPEDLAYTTDFVNNINNLWKCNKEDRYTFELVRRSKSRVVKGIKLEEFARAINAYLGQSPGQARSGPRTNLLKIQSEDGRYVFVNRQFKGEFIYKSSCTLKNLYKYYKPVNFAISLANYYQNNAARLKDNIKDKDTQLVISYGKWFFIAYVIYILNDEKHNDFSDFSVFSDYYRDEKKVDDCIIMFSHVYKDMFHGVKIDSNDFKKQKIYREFLKKEIKNDKKLNNLRNNIIYTFNYDKYIEISNDNEVAATINKENIQVS